MSEKIINIKNVLTLMLICCFLWINGITVHAESQAVNEKEPNNTKETAQLIQANAETAAGSVSGSDPGEYVVYGTGSKEDDDWYKVYLNAGEQYITCNGNPFKFEVYTDTQNLIFIGAYDGLGFGVKAYQFMAPSSGYYYVRVNGNSSTPRSYILMVGGPTYTFNSCRVQLDEVVMSNNRDGISVTDLSNIEAIPDGATIYMMSVSGVGSNAVSGISVTNMRVSNTQRLEKYTWQKQGLVSLNLPAKSSWQVTFTYSKNATFTPTLRLFYVYPVTSKFFENVTIP